MTIFLSLVVSLVLLVVWSMLMPIPVSQTTGLDSAESGEPSGIPLSADAYLKQNR
jgi:hypothetical protein